MSYRWIRTAALAAGGITLGGGLLWLVGRKIDLDQAAQLLSDTNYLWILVGMGLYAVGIGLRIARWHSLLSFRANVALTDTAIALVIGYAVNNLLPARLGEVVRADVLKRRNRFSRAAALGAIFIERGLDLAIVLCMLAIGLIFAPRRSAAIDNILLLVGIFGAGIVGILVVAIHYARSRSDIDTAQRSDVCAITNRVLVYLRGRVMDFAGSLQAFSTPYFKIAAAITLPIWLLESAAIWCVCRAVGIELDTVALAMVMAVASLSTLLPSAPGYVGGYQFAYVLALGLWNIGATQAAVAATSVTIYLIGGLTLAGVVTWIVSAVIPSRSHSDNLEKSTQQPLDTVVVPDAKSQDFWLNNLSHADSFTQWVYRRIAPWLGTNILELGCGTGTFTQLLAGDGRTVLAADLHAPYVAIAARKLQAAPNVTVICADVTKLDLKSLRLPDTVVMLDVLEHLSDDHDMLRRLHAMMLPGGTLILKIPALSWLYSPMDKAIGHYRRYSRDDVRQLFRQTGFACTSIEYFNVVGIVGWWLNGLVLKRLTPPAEQVALFELLVPILRPVDALFRKFAGLSLIAVARRE